MEIALAVAVFGALGCLTRYFVSGWVYGILGRGFPYGTFVVNIIGAYIIGLLMEFGMRSELIPPTLRMGLTIGFLGGLTTFSTFSAETVTLLLREEYLWTLAIILAHVVGSVGMTLLGILAMKLLTTMGAP